MVQYNHFIMLRVWAVVFFLILKLNNSLTFETYFHLGCFSSEGNFSQKHHGSNFWFNCINLCYVQKTVYAGINARSCLCGNEITRILHPANEMDCEVCFDSESHWGNTRYCGGSDTLSVYKLLPTRVLETSVLLATDRYIKIWGLENCVITFSKKDSVASVTFNPVTLDIYYISGSTLFKHEFGSYYKDYFSNPDTIKLLCTNRVGLALDWESEKNSVFWGCQDRIYWKAMDLNTQFQTLPDKLESFQIEPYRKFILLHTNATGLVKYDFFINSINHFLISDEPSNKILSRSFTVKHIALDIQQERIYCICISDGQRRLVSTDYNGAALKKFDLEKANLSNPFGIKVVNGTIVLGNKDDKNYTLYKTQVSCANKDDSCYLANVTILLTQAEKINDFEIYTNEMGRPSTNYLCESKNCSQMCYRVSASKVDCQCHDNLVLDEDGRTCIQATSTSAPTTSNELLNSQNTPTVFSSKPRTSTEPTTEKSLIFTRTSIEPTTEKSLIFTKDIDEVAVSPPTSSLETTLKKLEFYQSIHSVVLLIFLVILIIIVILLIHLSLGHRNINKNKQKRSELILLS